MKNLLAMSLTRKWAVIPAQAGIQVITRKWIPDYYLGNDDLIVFSGQ